MVRQRIFYDKNTGEGIYHYSNNAGITWDVEYEIENRLELSIRNPDTIGVIENETPMYLQDFMACNGWCVDVTQDPPALQFSYPDPSNPDETLDYKPPLSVKVINLEAQKAQLSLELSQTQLRLGQAEQEQAALLLTLVEKGVI